jgi:hypothetical protein
MTIIGNAKTASFRKPATGGFCREGNNMTSTEIIRKAQECLTVNDGKTVRKILDVESLLQKHGNDPVLVLLNQLLEEYRDKLKELIRKDKTDPEIDHTFASVLRIRMTINEIKKDQEVT